MKNECNIIRDILPLYVENMVSKETAGFVKEHLENCPDCSEEFEEMMEEMGNDSIIDEEEVDLKEEILKSLRKIRKRVLKKMLCTSAFFAAIFIVIMFTFHIFPIYRLIYIGPMTMDNFYTDEETEKAIYIGSAADRREAQAVLRLADKAFMDIQSTKAENKEEYGLLSRYATHTDVYGDAAFNEHSLELWSAHLEDDEGWIWVFYSSKTFNHDGSIARSSYRIPSLWKVEKSDTGEWVVVQIKEHP